MMRSISIVVLPFFWFLFRQAALVSFSCHEEHNPADKRHCAHDGRQWHVMCLFASRVNRSDVEDLFRGRVRKASSCKTEQPKHNQDDPKCFVHGGLLRHPAFRLAPYLLLQDLFDMRDFLVDLTAEFLGPAFGLQVMVISNPSHFYLIGRAWFHAFSSPLAVKHI